VLDEVEESEDPVEVLPVAVESLAGLPPVASNSLLDFVFDADAAPAASDDPPALSVFELPPFSDFDDPESPPDPVGTLEDSPFTGVIGASTAEVSAVNSSERST